MLSSLTLEREISRRRLAPAGGGPASSTTKGVIPPLSRLPLGGDGRFPRRHPLLIGCGLFLFIAAITCDGRTGVSGTDLGLVWMGLDGSLVSLLEIDSRSGLGVVWVWESGAFRSMANGAGQSGGGGEFLVSGWDGAHWLTGLPVIYPSLNCDDGVGASWDGKRRDRLFSAGRLGAVGVDDRGLVLYGGGGMCGHNFLPRVAVNPRAWNKWASWSWVLGILELIQAQKAFMVF